MHNVVLWKLRTKVGRGNLFPLHAITCRCPNTWRSRSGTWARFTMSLPARLQAASSEYQKLQVDLSNAVEARQRLDAQLSENELVKKVRKPKLLFLFRCAVARKFRIVVAA